MLRKRVNSGSQTSLTVPIGPFLCLAMMISATFFSSVFCGVYAQVMARLNKSPATIFLTVSVFPLIPGAALYYMMYGFVTRDMAFALSRGAELLLTCFGIVLGFMAVEVANKYMWRQ